MSHYCTYFDDGFLIQGLALWRSIQRIDSNATLWVLTLDRDAQDALEALKEENLRLIPVETLESFDPRLLSAASNRTRVEYYFTLSPCLPRYLLLKFPEIPVLIYVDADLMFFSPVMAILDIVFKEHASVIIIEHRFPSDIRAHYERHGRFNVGLIAFRNDILGRRVLEDWAARCIEWCYDKVTDVAYADQKYLDDWPCNFGSGVHILQHAGVNVAPWNWRRHKFSFPGAYKICVDGVPLVVFHFARFRSVAGTWLWQSGQLDYGVMPRPIRNAIYGRYWTALSSARREFEEHGIPLRRQRKKVRLGRHWLKQMTLRLIFGSDWFRTGNSFWSLRFGLGRFSGQSLALLRKYFTA